MHLKINISIKTLVLISLFAITYQVQAKLQEKNITYTAGNTELKGYMVWDDAKGKHQPGVLVVHEWWGLNDYARKRANMLAKLGYTALAVDMYGDGKNTEHAAEAKTFMNAVLEGQGVAQQRFLAAKAYLENQAQVDKQNIAAIGYCFGGATVLNMARQGIDLKSVVSFHGNLSTQSPAESGKVKAKVLVLNGANDEFIHQDSIEAFKNEMTQAGVDYQFINYPGALHGFTNPDANRLGKLNNLPVSYNAKADKQSWAAMKALFKQAFKP